MFSIKAITPPKDTLSPKKYERAIRTAQGIAETAGLQELRGSVRGWKHKVSFSIQRKGDDSDIVTDDEVFYYQDTGTRAHEIRPRRKRALYWKGASHPVKRVWHPGTPAQKFTEKAAAVMQKQYQRIVNEELAKAAR